MTDEAKQEELSNQDLQDQVEVLLAWFRSGHTNPYDAGNPIDDGEVLCFYGGPFYPEDELRSEFEGIKPEEAIIRASRKLEEESHVWDGSEANFLFEAITSNTKFYKTFERHILSNRRLLEVKVPKELEDTYVRLIYSNTITAMETYLSDAFVNTIFSDEDYVRKFVASNPDYRNETFSFADIYEKLGTVTERVKASLLELIWHRLDKVMPMYAKTFGIEFNKNAGTIIKAIRIRHDIVHRAGKTKFGEDVLLSRDDVRLLVDILVNFVDDIDHQMNELDPFWDAPF